MNYGLGLKNDYYIPFFNKVIIKYYKCYFNNYIIKMK